MNNISVNKVTTNISNDNLDFDFVDYLSNIINTEIDENQNFLEEIRDLYQIEEIIYRSIENFELLLKTRPEEAWIFGTQFIYTLRTYLTGSKIYFNLSSEDKVDPDGEITPISKFYSQDEILKHLSTRLTSVAILTKQLTNEMKNTQFFGNREKRIKEIWPQVIKLAYDGSSQRYISQQKANGFINGGHLIYKSQIADKNVNYTFTTQKGTNKRKILQRYYEKDGSFVAFNRGWLWQWLLEVQKSEEHLAKLEKSLQQDSFAPLILTRDEVRGTQQGDLRMGSQQRWVQIKMNNREIITKKNIITILTELKKYFSPTNQNIDENEFKAFFKKHFTPEVAGKESKAVNKRVKSLYKNLGRTK